MTVQEEIVYLHPRGAFHLGERGIGLEETADIIHADTLHAALCTAWTILYGEEALVEEWLRPDDPPVLLSSAFPFVGPVRFYPRPMLLVPGPTEEMEAPISLKKVLFISEGLLRQHLAGQPYPACENLHNGEVLLLAGEAETIRAAVNRTSLEDLRFWQVVQVPRVALDVVTNRSNIWFFGRVTFHEIAGFFFRVRYRTPEVADRFRAAVRLLGDTGLGGDRTSGHGLFTAQFEPAAPLGDPEADRFLTLAPLYPPRNQLDQLTGQACRYRWLTRGGWIGAATPTPYRRRTVRMFAEGSLLTGSASALWGALVDVTPTETPEPLPHPVYRYGFAFPVGVPPWSR